MLTSSGSWIGVCDARRLLEAEVRQGFPLRAHERVRIEMENRGSCCGYDGLRRRAEQQFGCGDSFDGAHTSTAEWASPRRTRLR